MKFYFNCCPEENKSHHFDGTNILWRNKPDFLQYLWEKVRSFQVYEKVTYLHLLV